MRISRDGVRAAEDDGHRTAHRRHEEKTRACSQGAGDPITAVRLEWTGPHHVRRVVCRRDI